MRKSSENRLFAIEVDRSEFDRVHDLPVDAKWREDLAAIAKAELGNELMRHVEIFGVLKPGIYRRPKNAGYAVIEWTGYRGFITPLVDWLKKTPGITRYGEVFTWSPQ